MARSSIQGASRAKEELAGRDTASLGPGDSSDSGSDMMGISDSAGGDPALPTDVALGDERPPLTPSADTLATTDDAAGTGERRSAGADGGKPDGWDIGVDQVLNPDVTEDADEDADVTFNDEVDTSNALLEDDRQDDEAEEDDVARGRRP